MGADLDRLRKSLYEGDNGQKSLAGQRLHATRQAVSIMPIETEGLYVETGYLDSR